ncbi:MAG: putative bifunctional diguanylate cyclase/phosphodiesterase [Acidimicrobiales bacterium]
MTVLPLVGSAWFAGGELTSRTAARDQARQVQRETVELVALNDLRSALIDERSWALAERGVHDLGLTVELVAERSGIDLVAEGALARAEVDELVVVTALPGLAERLSEIRQDDEADLPELSRRYGALDDEVGRRTDRLLDRLIARGGDVPGGGSLVTTLRVMDAASAARGAVAVQLWSYFGVQFSGEDVGLGELRSASGQLDLYNQSRDRIRRIAAPDSRAGEAISRVDASSDVARFERAVAELFTDAVANGLPGSDPSAVVLLLRADEIVEAFRAGRISSQLHLDLVAAAGADVGDAAASVGEAAAADARNAQIALAVVIVLSLLFGVALARFIGRPLLGLAADVRRLRDGDLSGVARVAGPYEVREAARALDEATAHLVIAERQATALAAGALDDPVLEQEPTGTLGASLQAAVRTLAASLSDRELLGTQLAHEAAHDGLTQLANRSASLDQLNDSLARARRSGHAVAVLFLDLDGFKDINDLHGHPAGDAVLCAIAQRLQEAVREGDHVGRLGGDEFLVIAEPVADVAAAMELAERLRHAASRPIQVGEVMLQVHASIGVAISGDSDLTPDEVLRDADLAVYKAKQQGRNRIELCDDELRAGLSEQISMEIALRRAIDEDELTVHYQPVVAPFSGRLAGFEALVRWERPGHGLVGAEGFVGFAERSDLIVDIDCWVLERVAAQLAAWQADEGSEAMDGVAVAVNMSARHLARDAFVDNVLVPLRRHGVPGSLLVLELSEASLLRDLDDAAEKLGLLRAEGVTIAIDDFGTGYTSLAQLEGLPVDVLKIDRSFVGDRASDSLVKLIIDTGHALGVRITAEGIETEEQAARLSELGSDGLQGYLYGRPVAPGDLGLAELSGREIGSVPR